MFIFPHSHMPQGAGIVCAHRRTCNLQEQGAPTCLATAAALSRHERVHARPASIGNGTSTGHRSTRPGMVVSFRASELFRGRQTHAGYRPPFEESFAPSAGEAHRRAERRPWCSSGFADQATAGFSAQAKRHCRHVVEAENHLKVRSRSTGRWWCAAMSGGTPVRRPAPSPQRDRRLPLRLRPTRTGRYRPAPRAARSSQGHAGEHLA